MESSGVFSPGKARPSEALLAKAKELAENPEFCANWPQATEAFFDWANDKIYILGPDGNEIAQTTLSGAFKLYEERK